MKRTMWIGLVTVIAGVSCTFGPVRASGFSTAPSDRQVSVDGFIDDAAHGGRPGFYFLPPLVASPSFGGVFDASLSPVVEVCTAIGDTCSLPLDAQFTTTGSGPARVRVDVAGERYGVNLATASLGLTRETAYILRVTAGDTELGRLQFVLVDRPDRQLGQSQGPLQLRYGTTVPIAFRVEQGAVPTGGPLTIHTAEDAGVHGLIGADGGTLTTSFRGVTSTLTIPAGALVEDVDITMTPIDAADNFPLSGGLTAGVQFGPEGLSLYRPATLRFDLPAGAAPGSLLGFKYAESGAEFHLTPADAGATSVTLQVTHFSGAGVGAGTFADVDAIMQQLLLEYTGRNIAPDVVYPTMMVHGGLIIADEVCGGTDVLNDCSTDAELEAHSERTINLFLQLLDTWYREGVKPLLEINALATENGLVRAAKQLTAWVGAAIQVFDVDLVAPLDTHREQGGLLLAKALKKAIEDDATACRDHEAIEWFGIADTLDLEGLAGLPTTIDGIAKLATCTVIDVTGAPSQLDHGGAATLTIKVGRNEQGQTTFLAWSEPVRMTVDGCGFLDNGPWYDGTVSAATMAFEVELDADFDESCTEVTVSMRTAHSTTAGTQWLLGAEHELTIPINATNITVTPEQAILQPSGTAQFTATVTGLDNTDVVWSATGGTITTDGTYTAGSTPGTYTVTAETVNGNPTQSATATVVILPVAAGRVVVDTRQSRAETTGIVTVAGLGYETLFDDDLDVSTASADIAARVSKTFDDGTNSAQSTADANQSANLVYSNDGSLQRLEATLDVTTLASRNSVTQSAGAQASGWTSFEIRFSVVGGTVAWQMSGLTVILRNTTARGTHTGTRFHLRNRTTAEDLLLVEETRDGQTGQTGQEFSTPLTGATVLTPGEYVLYVEVSAGTNAEFTGVRTASSQSTFTMTFTPQ